MTDPDRLPAEGFVPVVASNRGPFVFPSPASPRRGSGGLVTAFLPIMDGRGTWIASAMSESEAELAQDAGAAVECRVDGATYSIRYLTFDRLEYAQAYDEISNKVLWRAAHMLFDSAHSPLIDLEAYRAWQSGYVPFNRAFAETVAAELTPGRAGLIQDYHLYLVPGMVRDAGSDAPICFFLHTPFPDRGDLAHLPGSWVRQILAGVLGADLAGFHTPRWAKRFVAACEEALECEVDEVDPPEPPGSGLVGTIRYNGHTCNVGVFPLGVDTGELKATALTPKVAAESKRLGLDNRMAEEILIVRSDRLEPAKNIIRGIRAVDLLLERRSDLASRLRHLVLLHRSRTNLSEYVGYEEECIALVREINAKWMPRAGRDVIDIDIEDSYARTAAALREYDVLLANSIADGMNLVAREGPILNQTGGKVVVSSEAGAAWVYGDAALAVNPFDIVETAEALEAAIEADRVPGSPDDIRLRELAAANPPTDWLNAQLETVSEILSAR